MSVNARYEFTPDMGEISGFGGPYEACCQEMLRNALAWLDEHPDADPQFEGYQNLYGIITEENADAKALSKAMMVGPLVKEFGATGAMHQAVTGHALAVKRLGWDAYCAERREHEAKEPTDAE